MTKTRKNTSTDTAIPELLHALNQIQTIICTDMLSLFETDTLAKNIFNKAHEIFEVIDGLVREGKTSTIDQKGTAQTRSLKDEEMVSECGNLLASLDSIIKTETRLLKIEKLPGKFSADDKRKLTCLIKIYLDLSLAKHRLTYLNKKTHIHPSSIKKEMKKYEALNGEITAILNKIPQIDEKIIKKYKKTHQQLDDTIKKIEALRQSIEKHNSHQTTLLEQLADTQKTPLEKLTQPISLHQKNNHALMAEIQSKTQILDTLEKTYRTLADRLRKYYPLTVVKPDQLIKDTLKKSETFTNPKKLQKRSSRAINLLKLLNETPDPSAHELTLNKEISLLGTARSVIKKTRWDELAQTINNTSPALMTNLRAYTKNAGYEARNIEKPTDNTPPLIISIETQLQPILQNIEELKLADAMFDTLTDRKIERGEYRETLNALLKEARLAKQTLERALNERRTLERHRMEIRHQEKQLAKQQRPKNIFAFLLERIIYPLMPFEKTPAFRMPLKIVSAWVLPRRSHQHTRALVAPAPSVEPAAPAVQPEAPDHANPIAAEPLQIKKPLSFLARARGFSNRHPILSGFLIGLTVTTTLALLALIPPVGAAMMIVAGKITLAGLCALLLTPTIAGASSGIPKMLKAREEKKREEINKTVEQYQKTFNAAPAPTEEQKIGTPVNLTSKRSPLAHFSAFSSNGAQQPLSFNPDVLPKNTFTP